MELHSPPYLTLPALKIDKIRERQAVEDDPTVNNLTRSNLLLDGEFNRLYLDILEKSKNLLQLIRLKEEEVFSEYTSPARMLRQIRYHTRPGLQKSRFDLDFMSSMVKHRLFLTHKKPKRISKEKKKELDKVVSKLRKEVNTTLRRKVVRLSNKIQNSISAFEEKSNIDLRILSSTTIHFCKKCAKIISLDKFKRCTCACGEKITKISQVRQIPINHFNDRLINFLEQNYWLEHGVDYLLKRKNLQTLVGYYVLGHSGVSHEIDNIAESKSENYRFFCECKNAEVTVKDVFVFSGKMIDAGCSRGYIFTTSKEVSNEIVRLARSKNIDIIKGVLTREVKTLLKEIKEA